MQHVSNEELISAALSLAQDANFSDPGLFDIYSPKNDDQFLPLDMDPTVWTQQESPDISHMQTETKSTEDDKPTTWTMPTPVNKKCMIGGPMPTLNVSRNDKPRMVRRKSSSYRGVSYNCKSNKWKSVITINKKQCFLGYFEHEADAAMAYDEASRKHRGPHARLNFTRRRSSVSSDTSQKSSASEQKDTDEEQEQQRLQQHQQQLQQQQQNLHQQQQLQFAQQQSQQRSQFHQHEQSTGLLDRFSNASFDLPFNVMLSPSPPTSPLPNLDYIDAITPIVSKPQSSPKSRPRLDLEIPSSDDESEACSSPRKRLKSEENTMRFDDAMATTSEGSPVHSPKSQHSSATSPSTPSASWPKTSRFRGVSFNRKNGKYKSVLTFKGRQIFLGYFEDETKAAAAYDTACLQYRGRDAATLNFPLGAGTSPSEMQHTTSKYRGVSYCKQYNKWKAVITNNCVQTFCGYFGAEEEAARAYDRAAIKIRGPGTLLNFPEQQTCYTPTAELVEKSARMRLGSVDSAPQRQ